MSELLLQLVKALVETAANVLSAEQLKEWMDASFDKVEDMVADSETHWDDAITLPLIQALRSALDVPDNDE